MIQNAIASLVVGGVLVAGLVFGINMSKQPIPEPVRVGAVSGPDIYSSYLNVNGVTSWYYQSGLAQGASTTCSFQTPNATTTIVSAGIRFNLASSSASIVEIGQSPAKQATTTLLGTTYNIAAGAQATIVASTSPSGPSVVFAPNTWFNVKIGGGASGTVPTGNCVAEFRQI